MNELIDLMTLNEAGQLNEQLKELEQLEQEKRQRILSSAKMTSSQHQPAKVGQTIDFNSLFGSGQKQPANTAESASASTSAATSQTMRGAFNELINNANQEFEKEWESWGASTAVALDQSNQDDEFGFFMSAATTSTASSSAGLQQIGNPATGSSSGPNMSPASLNKQNSNSASKKQVKIESYIFFGFHICLNLSKNRTKS